MITAVVVKLFVVIAVAKTSSPWMPRVPPSPPLVGGRAATLPRATATATGLPPEETAESMTGTGVMNMAGIPVIAGTVAMTRVAVEMFGASLTVMSVMPMPMTGDGNLMAGWPTAMAVGGCRSPRRGRAATTIGTAMSTASLAVTGMVSAGVVVAMMVSMRW